MATSPFKFLDSYTKDDKDIFFGREREVEELYHRVFEGKIMLVYGVSGTGKSSLIHCGLANKFNEADWLPVNVRRAGDMVRSMAFAIGQVAITKMEGEVATPTQFKKAVRSLYLDHYKPVFFIFDQFEELFIFGNRDEKKAFIQIVKALTESDLQCRFMFVLREEYLAGITEFERVIPTILVNRVRIERMTLANAKQVIEGPCKVFNIEVEEGFSDEMLEKLSPGSAEVELTYLQVYLDKIYRLTTGERKISIKFQKGLLQQVGNVSDLLGSFLDEQIELLPDPDSALAVLKSFVSVKGTKRQMSPEEVQDYSQTLGKPISETALQELLQTLIQLRILRDKDQNNRYELRHDALATKIYEKITLVEKELLEIRHLIENGYHNWQKRGVLMGAEDLAYIAPYEDKLYLSNDLHSIIDLSKQKIYETKRKRKRLVYVAIIVAFISVSIFSIFSYQKQKIAELKAKIQKSKNLANKAWQYVDSDPTLAYILSEEAYNTYPTSEAEKGLINSYKNAPFYNQIYGTDILISESKELLLVRNTEDHILRLYNYEGNLLTEFIGHEDRIMKDGFKFSKNEEYVLSQSMSDSVIRVWNINGEEKFKIIGTNIYYIIPEDFLYEVKTDKYNKYEYSGKLIETFEFKDSVIDYRFINGILITKHKGGDFIARLAETNRLIAKKNMDENMDMVIMDSVNNCIVLTNKKEIAIWCWVKNNYNEIVLNKNIDMLNPFIFNEVLFCNIWYEDYSYEYLGYNLNNSNQFKIKGDQKIEDYEYNKAIDIFNNSLVILDENKFLISTNNNVYNFNGEYIYKIPGIFKSYNTKTKTIYTADAKNVNAYNLDFKYLYKIELEKLKIGIEFSLSPLLNANLNLLYDERNCYVLDSLNSIINLIQLKSHYIFNELSNGYYLFDPVEFPKSEFKIYRFDSNYFSKRNIKLVKNHKLQWCTNDLIITTKNDSIFIWKISGELILSKKALPEPLILKIDYNSSLNHIGIHYMSELEYEDDQTSAFLVIDLMSLEEVYSTRPHNYRLGFNMFPYEKYSMVAFEDSVVRYFDKNYTIIDSLNIGRMATNDLNNQFCVYVNNKSAIGYNAKNSKIIIFNIETRELTEIALPDFFRGQGYLYSIISENGELVGYYDFKLKTLNLFNLKGDLIWNKKINGDAVHGNSMLYYDEAAKQIILLSFTVDEYQNINKNYRKQMTAPSYITVYDVTKNQQKLTFKFDNIYNELNYISTSNSRALLGNYKNDFTYIDLNCFEILNSSGLNIENYRIKPDGKYLIYQTEEFFDILPLTPKEVIKRVREEKEFGEIREFTEQEKTEFGINN